MCFICRKFLNLRNYSYLSVSLDEAGRVPPEAAEAGGAAAALGTVGSAGEGQCQGREGQEHLR